MKTFSGMRLAAGSVLAASLFVLSPVVWAADAPAAAPAAAPASTAPQSPVIAVVDVDGVLQESTAAKSARAQIERFQQTFREEVAKEEAGLRNKQQDLQKAAKSLTQEQMAQKVRAFDQEVADFRRHAEQKSHALDKSFGAAMEQINQAMIETVRQVASTHGANVVLPRTQVMLFDEKMNITKEVSEGLNKKLADVTVPKPEVEAATGNGATKKKSK